MDKSGRKLTTWMLLGFAVICGAGGFVGGMVGLLIWVMPLELTVGIERFYELPNPLVPLVFFGSFLIGGAVGMITAAFILGFTIAQARIYQPAVQFHREFLCRGQRPAVRNHRGQPTS